MKYGVMYAPELIALAKEKGYQQLALTDINNTSSMLDFILASRQAGLHSVPGIEFREGAIFRFIGLARNIFGVAELNRLLEQSTLHGAAIPNHPGTLMHCHIIYDQPPTSYAALQSWEWVGVRPHEIHRKCREAGAGYQHKLVAWYPIVVARPEQRKVHRLLRCIDLQMRWDQLSEVALDLTPDSFPDLDTLRRYYAVAPDLLHRSNQLLASCQVHLEPGPQVNAHTYTGCRSTDRALLHSLAIAGRKRRYPPGAHVADAQLTRELELIEQLNFTGYFLHTWAITQLAAKRGFRYVGRGSGANSITAYCLGITQVDPIELNLYFERFINPHRPVPPDFDLDFCWTQRDDLLEAVHARFGSDRVALLATYPTFKGKSIVREVGKVLGMAKADLDTIIHQPLADDLHHPLADKIFKMGRLIQALPQFLNMHAGGLIIAARDLPFFTARTQMPKGFAVTHFDMHHAEQWGFHKYDLLSQRGIGHQNSTITIVHKQGQIPPKLQVSQHILQDKSALKRLARGDTLGCFYIESPAMRSLLLRLQCCSYAQLVAASSIIRPGVAGSGMMHAYIDRHLGRAHSFEVHPFLEQLLPETYGIMVYQEDVMKVLHHFAGLDLHAADMLRRLMTGKSKSQQDLERVRELFFEQARLKGHAPDLIREIWRQIASFSGYAFCKAHSATYAVESMQSLYLKARYPREFLVAVINNSGGFYPTETYVHALRKAGAILEAPCISCSGMDTSIEGRTVWIGLRQIKGIHSRSLDAIRKARQLRAFTSWKDFQLRTQLPPAQLRLLIRVGALRQLGRKAELYIQAQQSASTHARTMGTSSLFPEVNSQLMLPVLDAMPEHFNQQHLDEAELLGFPLCSPFQLLRGEIPPGCVLARDLHRHQGKQVHMLGYYILQKPVTTVRGKHMCYATWLDPVDDLFDTTHFPASLQRYPLLYRGIYLLEGRVVCAGNYAGMEVTRMQWLDSPFRDYVS